MELIYACVILLTCIIGSTVGLSGGLFIRPILDAIGYHNVLNISFLSSSAILAMATVSTIQKVRDGTKIAPGLALLISAGAAIGGVIGNLMLEHLVAAFYLEASAQRAQIILTVIALSLSIVLTTKKDLQAEIKSKLLTVIMGVLLGAVAAFSGIGGGPLNVPIMMIFFGMDMKRAAAYSIVIIFFSHFARLVTLGITMGYGYFDLRMLVFILPVAALGGLIGAKFSKMFMASTVKRLFVGAIWLVIGLNIFNWVFMI